MPVRPLSAGSPLATPSLGFSISRFVARALSRSKQWRGRQLCGDWALERLIVCHGHSIPLVRLPKVGAPFKLSFFLDSTSPGIQFTMPDILCGCAQCFREDDSLRLLPLRTVNLHILQHGWPSERQLKTYALDLTSRETSETRNKTQVIIRAPTSAGAEREESCSRRAPAHVPGGISGNRSCDEAPPQQYP